MKKLQSGHLPNQSFFFVDSADTQVFYTLDGTRPLPFKRGAGTATKATSSTCIYCAPFFLTSGKVSCG